MNSRSSRPPPSRQSPSIAAARHAARHRWGAARLRMVAALCLTVGGLVGGWWWSNSFRARPGGTSASAGTNQVGAAASAAAGSPVEPAAPETTSPFLNTSAEVAYVGSTACRDCHSEHDTTYRHTGMARSAAEVDLAREPPDGTYDHPASKRRYQVVRRDGQLWHRELRLTGAADEVVLAEYPMKYVVGSGRHSLTYVYEDDGFLMESPVTWYASRRAWGMSPGYDRPNHSSFEREAGEACLVCHVGRMTSIGGSLHRARIHDLTIGCEQCHGPGALHVERRKQATETAASAAEAIDNTIVNPAHLSRQLSEAICEQCHLRGAAVAFRRGRRLSDFRPGLNLDDFRYVFRLDPPDEQMTVVGHVEQMNLSRCYQQSTEFSCLTCHDPHGSDHGSDATERYNRICQRCHAPAKCTLPEPTRRQSSPGDSCIQCHMPASDTEIPHLAFTHHRVGIHKSSEQQAPISPGVGNDAYSLVPFRSLAQLRGLERTRAVGLAYLDASTRENALGRRQRFLDESLRLLSEYRVTGPADGIVDSSIARLRFDAELGNVLKYAESALVDRELEGLDRCNALFLVADSQLRQGQYQAALDALQQLQQLRRNSLQWLMQAECHQKLGNTAAAETALEQAVRINPRLDQVHRYLAGAYRQRGDLSRATWHEQRFGN